MDSLSDNTPPWHLINAALQHQLGTEEAAAFQQWLASDVQNRELFLQLQSAWEEGLNDYQAYQQANETIGWNALRSKLVEREQQAIPATAVRKGPVALIRKLSIAAIFIVASGIILWYMMANGNSKYTTDAKAQQSVTLEDGTVIKLFPSTHIEVPAGYNQVERKVILKNGEAFFEVPHNAAIPFIVDLGNAHVKDIGTGFRIRKINDSIQVSVVSGQVEFRDPANRQVNRLSAGMHLKFFPAQGNARPVIMIDSSARQTDHRLRFMNTPLPEVISRFKEVYNTQINIIDTALIHKRFTGHLEGQSLEGAMQVLCKSLNITFGKENDVYYLKKE